MDPYSEEADDRYFRWAFRVKALLSLARRWNVVSGKDERPIIADDVDHNDKKTAKARIMRWEARNAEAYLIITAMLGPNYKSSSGLTHCDNAKEMWDKIRYLHVDCAKGTKALRVTRRMHARTYRERTSLFEFAEGFMTDNMLLREYGVGMDDKLLMLTILRALPWHDDTVRRMLFRFPDAICDERKPSESTSGSPTDISTEFLRMLRDVDLAREQIRMLASGSGQAEKPRQRRRGKGRR